MVLDGGLTLKRINADGCEHLSRIVFLYFVLCGKSPRIFLDDKEILDHGNHQRAAGQ